MIIRKGVKAKLVRVTGSQDEPVVQYWSRWIGKTGTVLVDTLLPGLPGAGDYIEVEFPDLPDSSFPATLNEIELVP